MLPNSTYEGVNYPSLSSEGRPITSQLHPHYKPRLLHLAIATQPDSADIGNFSDTITD